MNIEVAIEQTPKLNDMWAEALHHVLKHRGGSALVSTVAEDVDRESLLDHLIQGRHVWFAWEDETLKGFAVVRRQVIEALYVAPGYRRQGVARALVMALNDGEVAPVDALALPGDRGTKSLYESIGWKARLLTMRAG